MKTSISKESVSSVGATITALHHEICGYAQSSYEKAVQIGELLIQEKSKLKQGNWLDWLEFNCPAIQERTAQRYMEIYRGRDSKSDKLSDTGSVYQLLMELFTVKEEKQVDDLYHEESSESEPEDEEEDKDNDPTGGAEARGTSEQTGDNGTREQASGVAPRPSPQDVIRAANQMEQAEAAISANMKAFLQVSEALLLIRQNRLYEIAQFRSFEEYCKDRWGFDWKLTKRGAG